MGFSLVLSGQIQPGVFYAQQRRDFLNTTLLRRSRAADAAKRLVRRIKRGPLISLEELLAADASLFFGSRRRDYYDLSWAFVHYLRHSVPDGQKRFSTLMASFARGSEAQEAFNEAYSLSPSSLERPLHNYIRNILAKPTHAPRHVLKGKPLQ